MDFKSLVHGAARGPAIISVSQAAGWRNWKSVRPSGRRKTFWLYLIDHNLVTLPYVVAKEAGEHNFHSETNFSVAIFNYSSHTRIFLGLLLEITNRIILCFVYLLSV